MNTTDDDLGTCWFCYNPTHEVLTDPFLGDEFGICIDCMDDPTDAN